jgi:iron-sulfur cluster repair protein YtfE (RIC family)
MSQSCGCRHEPGGRVPERRPITEDRTVGDVWHEYPDTVVTLTRLGIDHCCSAQLSLREAAAAAKIPVGRLLEALRAAA